MWRGEGREVLPLYEFWVIIYWTDDFTLYTKYYEVLVIFFSNYYYNLLRVICEDYISKYILGSVRYLGVERRPLAMSTPTNNERSPRKWIKQKFGSVFSSSRSPSRNLEVPDARSTDNIPPIKSSFLATQARGNSPSDGPRIIADRTGSGE